MFRIVLRALDRFATYNVENRLTQAISNLNGTDNYGYDPAGHRVWKQGPDGVTHVYYNGLDGKPLADFSLNPQTQQVQGGSPMLYFAGKRVDNAAVEDRLRTAVVENGQQRMGFFPYGSQRSGTASQVQYATYTRDSTTNPDHAQQRYYSSQIGRYTTPDPKPSSAKAGNPQSWNRYSYAQGDPINKTDPSGADPEFEDGEEMSPFGGMSSFGAEPTHSMVAGVPDFSITVVLGQGSGGNPDPNPPYPTWAVWVMAQALSKPFVYGVATAPPPQFGASSPLPAPSNGRNCTPAPATSGHYVTAAGQAAKMSAGCFSGLGPAQCTFGSGSAVSQVMAQSAQFQDVLGQYYMLGRTSGWQNFGAAGYATAGSNPVAQFTGSFGWKIAPASGGLNLRIAIQAVSQ